MRKLAACYLPLVLLFCNLIVVVVVVVVVVVAVVVVVRYYAIYTSNSN